MNSYSQSSSTATKNKKDNRIYFFIKRFLDIILSFIAIIILFPIFIITMIAIRVESKGYPIYSQKRVGKNGKEFVMYKFRSMCDDADEQLASLEKLNERDGPAFKIHHDPRITKVGSFIRKTCIDELPQLINVFKGDMSIVGPRPPLPKEVLKYNDYQMQRLLVTPGLTCYWQVIKGEDTTFDEWVELDLKYIREQNLLVDCSLIIATFSVLLKRNGDE